MAECMFMDKLVQDSPWKRGTPSYKLEYSNQTTHSKETQPISHFNRAINFQKQNILTLAINST
jgi:hypothetical protein